MSDHPSYHLLPIGHVLASGHDPSTCATCVSKQAPPLPESQQEWAIFWAFYRLTVDQRDRAWRRIKELEEVAS